MIDFISSAFLTLFVVIDPIGLIPIFVSLSDGMSGAERRRAAIKATVISIIVLTFFALAGHRFFDAMGISLPAFRIAGGLLLFWIAFEMAFEKRADRKSKAASKTVSDEQRDDIAAFPLAVPLMAGPGAITGVMLLAERGGNDPLMLGALLGTVYVVLGLTLLALLSASFVDQLLGPSVRNIITRLLGVVLAALAVQFVIDGAKAAFGT
ncbi:MAG: MarC family protein [Pseudomonadota bacterium]